MLETRKNRMAIVRLSIAALTTFSSFARASVSRGVFSNNIRKVAQRSIITSINQDSIILNLSRGGEIDSSTARSSSSDTKYVTLSEPAPGSPFHLAVPVHDLDLAKDFYGNVLGCKEGRSSSKWQDYSLNGHQIVCHWVGSSYRCQDYFNPVDGDDIPVPHFGLAMTEEEFHALAERLKNAGIKFIVEPHLRFKGQPGEQWTMFFKDPSGNNLEFKAMTNIENLFAKYNVVD